MAQATAASPADHRTLSARRRRLTGLVVTELRLLRRMHALTAVAVTTVLWVAILLLAPSGARPVLVPVVLLTDVTALGFLLVPALLLLERVERVTAAMRVTPVSGAEQAGVRVGVITSLSLLAALAVLVAAGSPAVGVALAGVASASVLVSLLSYAIVRSAPTLTTVLLRAPLVAAPLMTPAIADLAGLTDSPWLHLSPLVSAADMMRGQFHWAAASWQLLWIAAAGWAAVHGGHRSRTHEAMTATGGTLARRRPWPAATGAYTRWRAVGSFARADRRTLAGDGVLLLLAVSVPLLALVARVTGTAGVAWFRARHGIDIQPHLPVVWVLLLVAHTPVVFGAVTGLLLLEDRDAGVLPAVATTRAGLGTLLGYRLGTTVACTAVAMAVALPVGGIAHPAGAVGLLAVAVAAAALSTVPALLLAALSSNRLQGVAVMKIIGLPLYLPMASWFLDGPARWAFAVIPSAWTMWTMWAATPAGAAGMAAGTVAVCALAGVVLTRRYLRRALP